MDEQVGIGKYINKYPWPSTERKRRRRKERQRKEDNNNRKLFDWPEMYRVTNRLVKKRRKRYN